MKTLFILTFVISAALSAASVSENSRFSTPEKGAFMNEMNDGREFSEDLFNTRQGCWKDSDCSTGNICCGTGIPPMQEGYCWYQCN